MHQVEKVSAGRLGFYFSGHQYLPTWTIKSEIIIHYDRNYYYEESSLLP